MRYMKLAVTVMVFEKPGFGVCQGFTFSFDRGKSSELRYDQVREKQRDLLTDHTVCQVN